MCEIRPRTLLVLGLVLALGMLALPATAQVGVAIGISVHTAPPPLPVYAQPICPAPGYIWTPGYWAWGPGGYYWVAGAWIMPPQVGLLWTPGYWGWGGGAFIWHAGYWGPHVGFYGGVNYGFGYTGVGYAGGYWRGRMFYYNRAVSHINVAVIHNTYSRTVINTRVNRVSYNGGTGGIRARPTATERAAMNERHFAATERQTARERSFEARRGPQATNRGLRRGGMAAGPARQREAREGRPQARAKGNPHGNPNRGARRGEKNGQNQKKNGDRRPPQG